eukprot:750438-Hanusia_phi.AAC.2
MSDVKTISLVENTDDLEDTQQAEDAEIEVGRRLQSQHDGSSERRENDNEVEDLARVNHREGIVHPVEHDPRARPSRRPHLRVHRVEQKVHNQQRPQHALTGLRGVDPACIAHNTSGHRAANTEEEEERRQAAAKRGNKVSPAQILSQPLHRRQLFTGLELSDRRSCRPGHPSSPSAPLLLPVRRVLQDAKCMTPLELSDISLACLQHCQTVAAPGVASQKARCVEHDCFVAGDASNLTEGEACRKRGGCANLEDVEETNAISDIA